MNNQSSKEDAVDVLIILDEFIEKNKAYWDQQLAAAKKRAKGQSVHFIREDFEYIVERKEQERICFLSGQNRYPLKIKPAMTRTLLDPDSNGFVQKITKKVRSNRGVGGLAALEKRFLQKAIPKGSDVSAHKLPLVKRVEKYVEFPFGKSLKEKKEYKNTNPGPGYYDKPKQCRKLPKQYCGKNLRIVPCVEVRCVAKPTDTCYICQKSFYGDYWHSEYIIFLCLQCMRNERKMKTKFKLCELNRFKKIRNCSFKHDHEGTTAAVRKLTKAQLRSKFRIENYLEQYFNKYY